MDSRAPVHDGCRPAPPRVAVLAELIGDFHHHFLTKMSVIPKISERFLSDIAISWNKISGSDMYYSDGLAAQYECVLVLTRTDGVQWRYYISDKLFIRRSGDDTYDDVIKRWLFE